MYHLEQLLTGEFMTCVSALEYILHQFALLFMQTLYLLLYGTGGYEVIYGDVLLLTYAMGTVGSLCLYGRIPPWVHVNDVVGTGEVQTQSAGFQRYEEYRTFTSLELLYQSLALLDWHGAIDVEVWYAGVVECLLDECEVGCELREYEYAVFRFLCRLLHLYLVRLRDVHLAEALKYGLQQFYECYNL